MKKQRLPSRLRLSILFSLVVFCIFMLTSVIMGMFAMLVINTGLIDTLVEHPFPWPLLLFLLVSVAVGTVISFFASRLPLKPIHAMIDATNALAKGDFSARLSIVRPPDFHELAESFNRMAEELENTEMLRADFINDFSHEFKTPIVSIKGFAEMLKSDDLTREQREEYLDIIISESGRLTALATNVLNLSKVENQTILSGRKRFDLTEQLRRAVVLLESRWEEKRINLTVDLEEISYEGNEEQLNQIWVNLLDNAVKFTPDEGRIALSLKKEEGAIIFSLADSGCGIPREDQPRIFDKFYQADASHAAKGNGLGLALAQRVAELHGGSIVCQSAEGKGTRFIVTLPEAA